MFQFPACCCMCAPVLCHSKASLANFYPFNRVASAYANINTGGFSPEVRSVLTSTTPRQIERHTRKDRPYRHYCRVCVRGDVDDGGVEDGDDDDRRGLVVRATVPYPSSSSAITRAERAGERERKSGNAAVAASSCYPATEACRAATVPPPSVERSIECDLDPQSHACGCQQQRRRPIVETIVDSATPTQAAPIPPSPHIHHHPL
uniref:Secreted protein n=1 Tax=Plectus sambesii TaxID=2011161 RepID=A0A914VWY7_9BILA